MHGADLPCSSAQRPERIGADPIPDVHSPPELWSEIRTFPTNFNTDCLPRDNGLRTCSFLYMAV